MHRRIFTPEFIASVRSFCVPAANSSKQDVAKWQAQKFREAAIGAGIGTSIGLARAKDADDIVMYMPTGALVGFAGVFFLPISLALVPIVGAGVWRAHVLERKKQHKWMEDRIEGLTKDRKEAWANVHLLRAQLHGDVK